MHEVAIAEALLDVVLAQARERRVARVQVAIGRLRQVVPAALTFAWEVASRETAAEGAVLGIRVVPVRGRCGDCGVEGALVEFPLCCPTCRSWDLRITEGEELCVEWLDIDETAGEGGTHG